MVDPSKVSTPEEVAEAMESYRRQTGHYPPAVWLHPNTRDAIIAALPSHAIAGVASLVGGLDLLPQPYLPRGMLLFCERDGSVPGLKPSLLSNPLPLLSLGYAELTITDSLGAKKSLGTVTDVRIDDPEDLLRIPTYTPASPAEIARRLTEEFGV